MRVVKSKLKIRQAEYQQDRKGMYMYFSDGIDFYPFAEMLPTEEDGVLVQKLTSKVLLFAKPHEDGLVTYWTCTYKN